MNNESKKTWALLRLASNPIKPYLRDCRLCIHYDKEEISKVHFLGIFSLLFGIEPVQTIKTGDCQYRDSCTSEHRHINALGVFVAVDDHHYFGPDMYETDLEAYYDRYLSKSRNP